MDEERLFPASKPIVCEEKSIEPFFQVKCCKDKAKCNLYLQFELPTRGEMTQKYHKYTHTHTLNSIHFLQQNQTATTKIKHPFHFNNHIRTFTPTFNHCDLYPTERKKTTSGMEFSRIFINSHDHDTSIPLLFVCSFMCVFQLIFCQFVCFIASDQRKIPPFSRNHCKWTVVCVIVSILR